MQKFLTKVGFFFKQLLANCVSCRQAPKYLDNYLKQVQAFQLNKIMEQLLSILQVE